MPLVLELVADKLLHPTPKLEEYWVNNNNNDVNLPLSIYLVVVRQGTKSKTMIKLYIADSFYLSI